MTAGARRWLPTTSSRPTGAGSRRLTGLGFRGWPHRAGVPELGLAGLARVDLVIAARRAPGAAAVRELGVPVLLKRDDLAGVGLGGNKLRGLEFLIADALAQGCDSLVTGAGPQSNWTMLAALACLRYGLEPHVVCYGEATRHEAAGHGEHAAAPLARGGRAVHRGAGAVVGGRGHRGGHSRAPGGGPPPVPGAAGRRDAAGCARVCPGQRRAGRPAGRAG